MSVAIVRGKDATKNTIEALKLINAKQVIKAEDRIVIKVNLLEDFGYDMGTSSRPESVRGIIHYLKKNEFDDITVVEGSNKDTEVALQNTGMGAMLQQEGINFIDLNETELVQVRGLPISKVVLDADVVVSTTPMKTHYHCRYSLTMKNLFGCTVVPKDENLRLPWRRARVVHPILEEKGMCDEALQQLLNNVEKLTDVIKPKICIIDAMIGIEGQGPTKGDIVPNIDMIIAGNDPRETDAVGAYLMGFEKKIKEIKVLGEDPKKVRMQFKKPILSA